MDRIDLKFSKASQDIETYCLHKTDHDMRERLASAYQHHASSLYDFKQTMAKVALGAGIVLGSYFLLSPDADHQKNSARTAMHNIARAILCVYGIGVVGVQSSIAIAQHREIRRADNTINNIADDVDRMVAEIHASRASTPEDPFDRQYEELVDTTTMAELKDK